MKNSALLQAWLKEETVPFTGWDFSYLEGRMIEDRPPWSFEEQAVALMRDARCVMDMDTGGGERLITFLQQHQPPFACAMESYPPNTILAHKNLAPFGVPVIKAEADENTPMPFADGAFDLILNRHGSFNADEIGRVLAPGGVFLTKQVHGLWAHDLLAIFGVKPPWPDAIPRRYVPLLENAGLTVVNVEDWRGLLRFTDVGAIVYYLHAVPWLVPGFSVETHQTALFHLQAQLDRGDPLAFFAGTYKIEAQKIVK